MRSVFFSHRGIFFSVSHHLQFFFGFPLENIIFFPTTSANWWEMVGKRIFWWEKVVVPRGYIQNFPPIFPPFPSGKKKHCGKKSKQAKEAMKVGRPLLSDRDVDAMST